MLSTFSFFFHILQHCTDWGKIAIFCSVALAEAVMPIPIYSLQNSGEEKCVALHPYIAHCVLLGPNYIEGKGEKNSTAPSLGCVTLNQCKNWRPVNWSPSGH